MIASPCLSDDVLHSLLIGAMGDDEVAACESHLAECSQCLVRTRHLKTSDTLSDLLVGAKDIPWSRDEEDEMERLTSRLTDRSQLLARPALTEGLAVPTPADRTNPSEDLLAVSEIAAPPATGLTSSSMTPNEPTAVTVIHGDKAAPPSNTVHTMVLQPSEGTVLGVYRLEKKLGEGGMGAVWKAFHTRLKKHVALKVLPAHLLRDAGLVARFEREMESVGRLDHPSIVRAMDADEVEGTHFLVMEYVDGQDLGQLVKARGARMVREACEMIRQAAVGLAYAHKNGLVHRDIKPSNLFLTKDGKIKILDLGLARLQGDGLAADVGAGLTGTGQVLGTPDYMAPEQWEDTHTVGPACDLYALGCTLFFLLTGRAPFADDRHQTLPRKMKGHVAEAPPELSTVRGTLLSRVKKPAPSDSPPAAESHNVPPAHDIPPEVEAVYQRLMAKEPSERFASADELAEALLAIVKSKKAAAPSDASIDLAIGPAPADTPPQPPTVAATPASDMPPTASQPTLPPAPPRGKKWLAWGSLGAVLLMGVIIITIRNKDGSTTKLEVDDSSEVTVSRKGDAAGSASGPQPSTINPQPSGWHGWPADAPKPAIAPFDAAQAKKHQEEWAKYLNVPVEYTNSLGMKFRLIPPGEFTMGSTKQEITEELEVETDGHTRDSIKSQSPRHRVVLTTPFYFAVTETTWASHGRVMGYNPAHASLSLPRVQVNWNDSAEFTARLSQREKFNPCYSRVAEVVTRLSGDGYRLPTEAEWEFACRAGTETRYWCGEKIENLEQSEWCTENSPSEVRPVAQLKANPFGLYDILGNVAEWTQDSWDPEYYVLCAQSQSPVVDPEGAVGSDYLVIGGGGKAETTRIWRGGSVYEKPIACRSARRTVSWLSNHQPNVGLRVVLPVDAVRQALKVEGPAIPKVKPASEAPPAQEPVDYAAERKAAEWVLKIGASLALIDANGNPLELADGKLPTQPFAVSSVNLEGDFQIDEADLKTLSPCRRLSAVRIMFGKWISGDGLRHLAPCDSLQRLEIGTAGLTDAGVDSLRLLPQLRSLSVTAPQLTNEALKSIGTLTRLEWLDLTAPRLDDEGVSRLDALQNLQSFFADFPTDAGLDRLVEAHRNLKRIGISNSAGRPLRTMNPLARLAGLADLSASTDQLSAEGVGGLTALTVLRLYGPLGAEHADRIAQIRTVRELIIDPRVEGSTIGKTGWERIVTLPDLTGLELKAAEKIPFDDACLRVLGDAPKLSYVHLFGSSKVTPAGIEAFRKARPDVTLRIDAKEYPATVAANSDGIDYAAERKAAEALIAFRKTHPLGAKINLRLAKTGALFEHPSEVSQLPAEPFTVSQIIDYPGHVTDDVLALLRECRQLEMLDLAYGKTPITDEGLRHLRGLHSLIDLRLANCGQLKGEVAALISANPNLEWVDLHSGPDVSPQALLASLRGCQRLRKLFLEGRQAIPEFYPVLAEHCRGLQALEIGENHGVDLPALASLPHLRQIAISGEHLKPERFEANLKALQEMRSLEQLSLAPPATDAYLARLAPLRNKLRSLHVVSTFEWDPGVTPRGWKALDEFTALETLEIGGHKSAIDGPALLRFAKLPALRKLVVRFEEDKQQFSISDVMEFRKQRPDVELVAAVGKEWKTFHALEHYPKGPDGRSMAAWDLPKDAPAPAVVPFTPDEAKAHQEAWAKYTKQPVEVENSLGMKFRLIPPGQHFIPLHANGQQPGEGPKILYRLTQPYHLGTTEVTVGQFRKFLDETGYQPTGTQPGGDTVHALLGDWKPNGFWKDLPYPLRDDDPAILVSHADASAFCEWLSKKEGAVYRLPTECEWFFACGAGGDKRYGCIETIEELREHGWDLSSWKMPISKESSPLHQIGTLKANPFGLFDMFGNEHELARDRLPVDRLADLSLINPTGHAGPFASYCGGSWYGGFDTAYPWLNRGWDDVPVSRGHAHIGFRVLKELPGAKPLPKPFERPVMVNPGRPLSSQALVSRPAAIPGLRSWTIEPASHSGSSLAAIAWSPRGDLIATAHGNDSCIRLWDRDGNLKRVLLGHEEEVTSLSFSHDGALLASGERRTSGGGEGTVRVWDVATGTTRAVIPCPKWVGSVTFSPVGRELAIEQGSLMLVDLDSGRTRTWNGLPPRTNPWSPDGQALVVNSEEDIAVFRPSTSSTPVTLEKPDGNVGRKSYSSVAWSPDGKWIAAGNFRHVRLWNAETRALHRSIETEFGNVLSTLWSRDSRRLLVAGEAGGAWSTYDAVEGTRLIECKSPQSYRAAWNPDETEIAAWDHNAGGPLVFLDAASGKELRRGKYRGIASGWLGGPTAEGRTIHGTLSGGKVRAFDAATGRFSREIADFRVTGTSAHPFAQASPSGRRLAVWWPEFPFTRGIVDTETGRTLQRFEVVGQKPEEAALGDVVWSPDDRFVATAGIDGKIRLWNAETGAVTRELSGHVGTVWNLAWSPDGTRLASLGNDKTVRLWNPAVDQPVATFRDFPDTLHTYFTYGVYYRRMVWSADSRELWIVLSTHAVPLEVATGRFGSMVNLSKGNALGSLALSPDGDRLVGREGYGWTILHDLPANRRHGLGRNLGWDPQWLPDGRRMFGFEAPTRRGIAYDTRTNQRLGTLIPAIGGDGGFTDWLCVGPTGHYRGSAKIDDHIVYVAMHDGGSQVTYTPAEFREKFGWKNDPTKATLMKLSE